MAITGDGVGDNVIPFPRPADAAMRRLLARLAGEARVTAALVDAALAALLDASPAVRGRDARDLVEAIRLLEGLRCRIAAGERLAR